MKTKIFITIAVATLLFACTKTDPRLVTIAGKITNPIGELVSFQGNDTSYTTNASQDGSFKITFSLDSSTYLYFQHGEEITAMYVKPGDNIRLTIDTKQFDESIKYEGSEESSFLAKKYLLNEAGDFNGKVFYMSSPEDYKSILDEYKTSLIKELESIKDSSFVKNEIKEINDDIDYLIYGQERLSGYGDDIRLYKFETSNMEMEFNFYGAVNSLDSIEFNGMLQDYADKRTSMLINVNDKDFVKEERERIEKTVSTWKERKIAMDNMPKEGEPAIDFIYPDKDGNEYSLSSFKGSLVYVDVWATWCGPCKAEIPALQKLEEEYHGRNITFVSISVDSEKDEWLKMLNDKKLGGIQLWAGGRSKIAKDYAIFGIPRFMLFSVDGNVISTDAPRPSSNEIRGLLNSNL